MTENRVSADGLGNRRATVALIVAWLATVALVLFEPYLFLVTLIPATAAHSLSRFGWRNGFVLTGVVAAAWWGFVWFGVFPDGVAPGI